MRAQSSSHRIRPRQLAGRRAPALAIYCLRDPRDGTVRYVGVTENPMERLSVHTAQASADGTPKERWIDDLARSGLAPEMVILELVSYEKGREAEQRWIAEWRDRGTLLLNMTTGGHIPGEMATAGAGESDRSPFAALGDASFAPLQAWARLAIVAELDRQSPLSFTQLRHRLGLTDGNIAIHARRLVSVGYIATERRLQGSFTVSYFWATDQGRAAWRAYRQAVAVTNSAPDPEQETLEDLS